MNTHYTVLGLGEQATLSDIKREYRRQALLTHPDRTADPAAHQRYLAVNEAYETLSDPARRASYDAALARLRRPQPVVPNVAYEPHPDPAMRRRGRPRRPITKAEAAARAAASYPAQYAYYMPWARRINVVVLGFALLLLLDSQWNIKYTNQRVQRVTEHVVRGKGGTADFHFRVETPDLNFRLEQKMLSEGEMIDVACSALFRQARIIWPAGSADPDRRILIDTLYDGLLFLPLLMAVVAAVGSWPPPGNRRIVDTAAMALVLALIHGYLLLRS